MVVVVVEVVCHIQLHHQTSQEQVLTLQQQQQLVVMALSARASRCGDVTLTAWQGLCWAALQRLAPVSEALHQEMTAIGRGGVRGRGLQHTGGVLFAMSANTVDRLCLFVGLALRVGQAVAGEAAGWRGGRVGFQHLSRHWVWVAVRRGADAIQQH